MPLQPDRSIVRDRTPRVRALTSVELARDGAAASARLPSDAWRAAHEALDRGPVLVQVPRSGYLPAIACARCRALARCATCHGALSLSSSHAPPQCCLLYTSDAADDLTRVDLGGRRIIKKKKEK